MAFADSVSRTFRTSASPVVSCTGSVSGRSSLAMSSDAGAFMAVAASR